MTEYSFTAAALTEFQDAVAHYERERLGLGDEFRAEVRRTARSICEMPHMYQGLDETFRRARTKRFPYGLVYTIEREQIVIHAVMHLHRRPEYWRNRLS
jgi:plasmid stabilization system protein ParE